MANICSRCNAVNQAQARFCGQCGAPLGAAGPLSAGTVLRGKYRVVQKLGKGGMGMVYLVEDQELPGKQWALKEMQDTSTDPKARAESFKLFKQEAQLLANLKHPNLPQVNSFFPENGRYYLVMEYVEGQTLEEILSNTSGFLSAQQVTDWAVQICEVLEYLHAQKPKSIIFRDMKPENIMLTPQGQVKLIDFGIAKLFDPAKGTDTVNIGTIGYAAPEQYGGQGGVDPRTDVFGLGATLHHLVTKRDPRSEAPFSFHQAPPRRLNPQCPPQLEMIIMRAVEYNRDKRFSSAAEMKMALSGQSSPAVAAAAVSTVKSVKCPSCGEANLQGQQFCSHCGAQINAPTPPQSVSRCWQCGALNLSDKKFCGQCGYELISFRETISLRMQTRNDRYLLIDRKIPVLYTIFRPKWGDRPWSITLLIGLSVLAWFYTFRVAAQTIGWGSVWFVVSMIAVLVNFVMGVGANWARRVSILTSVLGILIIGAVEARILLDTTTYSIFTLLQLGMGALIITFFAYQVVYLFTYKAKDFFVPLVNLSNRPSDPSKGIGIVGWLTVVPRKELLNREREGWLLALAETGTFSILGIMVAGGTILTLILLNRVAYRTVIIGVVLLFTLIFTIYFQAFLYLLRKEVRDEF